MTAYEAAAARRTIRKFKQKPIPRTNLERYVNAARLAPSGMNMQCLKYVIVDGKAKVAKVFAHVKWAGYIAPAGDPAKGEEPTAYIIVLADTEIRSSGYELDAGAAIQNVLLTAWDDGVGACWMGAVDRDAIRAALGIPERYIIVNVLALGYKAEDPKVDPFADTVKYHKDEAGRLHVPKRGLAEVLLKL